MSRGLILTVILIFATPVAAIYFLIGPTETRCEVIEKQNWTHRICYINHKLTAQAGRIVTVCRSALGVPSHKIGEYYSCYCLGEFCGYEGIGDFDIPIAVLIAAFTLMIFGRG